MNIPAGLPGGGASPGIGGGVPGPGGTSPGGRSGPGGMVIDFRRLETAKARLTIDWRFPVYAPDLAAPQDDGRTTSGRAAVALPREKALLELGATDHRPLLIVRECDRCAGSDDALLDRRLNAEKTLLLTRWFHCVKLPNHVLDADHPFRNLFDEEHPPHLFLCRHDGSEPVALYGQQTQSQLWSAMERLISREYEGDPRSAVRGLLRVLNEYDTIDSMERELRVRLEESLDDDGPDTPKARSLQRKLDRLAKQRAEAEAKEAKLADLRLRELPADAAPATDRKSGAGKSGD